MPSAVLRLDDRQTHSCMARPPAALARLDAALAQNAHRRPGHQRAIFALLLAAMPLLRPVGHGADRARARCALPANKLGLELAVAAAWPRPCWPNARSKAPTPSAAPMFPFARRGHSPCGLQYQGEPVVATLPTPRWPAAQWGAGDFQPLEVNALPNGAWPSLWPTARACVRLRPGETEYLFTRRGATQHRADVLAPRLGRGRAVASRPPSRKGCRCREGGRYGHKGQPLR